VDLRSGQERADADVHREPALDPLDDPADDDLPLGVGLLDLVPDLHLLGFFTREDDVAVAVFGTLEQHVDDVAGLDRHFAGLIEELVDGDDALGLVPDVHDHFGRGHLENRSLDDFAFRDVAEAVIVGIEQPSVLGRIHLLVVFPRPCFQRAAVRAVAALSAFAGRDACAAPRTGSVLVFYVRHALRVLLSSFDVRSGRPGALSKGSVDCRCICGGRRLPPGGFGNAVSIRAYDTYRSTVQGRKDTKTWPNPTPTPPERPRAPPTEQ